MLTPQQTLYLSEAFQSQFQLIALMYQSSLLGYINYLKDPEKKLTQIEFHEEFTKQLMDSGKVEVISFRNKDLPRVARILDSIKSYELSEVQYDKLSFKMTHFTGCLLNLNFEDTDLSWNFFDSAFHNFLNDIESILDGPVVKAQFQVSSKYPIILRSIVRFVVARIKRPSTRIPSETFEMA